MRPPVNCRGPVGITRRNMLQIGAIGSLNLALPQVLVLARGASGRAPRLGARAALPLLAYALYTTRSLGALLAAGVPLGSRAARKTLYVAGR